MASPHTPHKSPSINADDKVRKEDVLGTLIVILLKARNLNDKHSFRKSDVFAQAILNGVQKRSHVDVKGGQHPEWDSEVRFTIMKSTAGKHRKMDVACYSQEPRSEDLMGKAVVDIGETLKTGEFDDWVPLEVDGVARGELYLEMTYYANAPAPAVVTGTAPNKMLLSVSNQNSGLSRRPSRLAPSERLSRPQYQQQAGRPQSHNLGSEAYPPAQGHAYNPQASSSIHHSPEPPHGTRLGSHHTLPARENSGSTIMPGSYPTGPIQSSPQRKLEDLPPTPQQQQQQQQPPALPTILRPGPGSGSTPTPIPHPQHQYSHSRHPSDPSFSLSSNHHGTSPHGSPPNRNPYLDSSGSSTPTSPNPYLGNTIPPLNPYISNNSPPRSYINSNVSNPPPNANPYTGASSAHSLAPGHVPGRAYSPGPPLHNSVHQSNAYNGSIASPIQGPGNVPYAGYATPRQPSEPPPLWRQDHMTGAPQTQAGNPFSFPIPTVPAGRNPSYDNHEYRHQTMSVGYSQRPPPTPSRDERDFDPHFQTRYQTPLPLPPDAVRQAPPSSVHTHTHHTHTYDRPPTPPRKADTLHAPDGGRLEALRRAEDAAARRRAQELKDLELAMQLDRELNLEEERANAAAAAR